MEELKLLIEMVSNLPTLAIWVLIGYFVYKVCIVGSVFGVVRLAIFKLYKAYKHSKTKKPEPKIVKTDYINEIDALCIKGCVFPLIYQIQRLRGVSGRAGQSSTYLHIEDVDWLEGAIDEKIGGQSLRKLKDIDC